MIIKKSARGGNYMNGGAPAKSAVKERKASRNARNPYENIELVRPIGKPSFSEKKLAETIRKVNEEEDRKEA